MGPILMGHHPHHPPLHLDLPPHNLHYPRPPQVVSFRQCQPVVPLDTIDKAAQITVKQYESSPPPLPSVPVKKAKLKQKLLLQDMQGKKHIMPGLWLQGQPLPDSYRLDRAEIERQTLAYHDQEAHKIFLWEDNKDSLDKFFISIFQFDKNPLFQQYPNIYVTSHGLPFFPKSILLGLLAVLFCS